MTNLGLCGSCIFFRQDNGDEKNGECRVKPPANWRGEATFPRVTSDAWCGSFQTMVKQPLLYTCGECQHFTVGIEEVSYTRRNMPITHTFYGSQQYQIDNNGGKYGNCRFMPPQQRKEGDAIFWTWPIVEKSNGCSHCKDGHAGKDHESLKRDQKS